MCVSVQPNLHSTSSITWFCAHTSAGSSSWGGFVNILFSFLSISFLIYFEHIADPHHTYTHTQTHTVFPNTLCHYQQYASTILTQQEVMLDPSSCALVLKGALAATGLCACACACAASPAG